MKCLLVSDLHYTLKQFDWVLKSAKDFDVVVIAGDLLDISSPVAPQSQITVALTYLEKLKSITRLIVCSGNHDLNARNENGEKYAKWISQISDSGISSDGGSLKINKILFTVYPWWDGPDVKQKIVTQLENDSNIEKERWIWVYHPPPGDSPVSWDGKRYYGDEDLLDWIDGYKPDIVLGGHVHQSPFSKEGSWIDQIGSTWVFNPGRQIGPVPCHVIFNIKINEALWFSMAGAEIAKLNKKLTRPVENLSELPAWLT